MYSKEKNGNKDTDKNNYNIKNKSKDKSIDTAKDKKERVVFRELTPLNNVKKIIDNIASEIKIQEELVNIFNLNGRVCAEDIYAPIDIPPFDRATMDGYAVRADDTFRADEENPVELKVIGKIEAGDDTIFNLNKGEAVEISTGAPMTKGSNSVIMVEYTNKTQKDTVLIYKPVAPGENVIAAGTDIMAGELILRKGTKITARDVAILSAVGIDKVKVVKKPVVAVISTGNEIIEPGKQLNYGKIYDVNSIALNFLIESNGGVAKFLGIANDNPDIIKKKIKRASKIADVVILSGGTSAGVGDLMHSLVREEGEILVHGVAVKPGKPTIVAKVHDKPLFGLPGYPVSAMMIFEILVADFLRKISRIPLKKESESRFKVRLGRKTFSGEGRREFLPVNIVGKSAYPVTGSYSAAISKLVEADGFIEIPEDIVIIEEGEEIEVTLFSTLKPADLTIIGSHCVGIDILLRMMREKQTLTIKVINAGSSGGLVAVRRGEADIAGTHLLDEKTGIYNVPYIEKFGLSNVVLVKGYHREQGLITAKNNPKRIKTVEDIFREDITIINRNPGSGTRVLLDMYIKEIAEEKNDDFNELIKTIDGYPIEAKSHTAVASSILMGKADIGLGIKTVAERYGLNFIPLRDEEYDFVIRKESLSKETVKEFIETLRSKEFKFELEKRLPGMKITENTGHIIEF